MGITVYRGQYGKALEKAKIRKAKAKFKELQEGKKKKKKKKKKKNIGFRSEAKASKRPKSKQWSIMGFGKV